MSQDLNHPGPPPPPAAVLKGREVVVGVCGSIACYKACEIVSRLVQLGAGVSVVMTANATKFVTPLTFEALSNRPVRTETFSLVDTSDPQHISLTERADLMLVAPVTTNVIAKVACGLCDDLLTTLICASACPVVFAPAMNHRMWDHPIAQENYAKLAQLGYRFLGPEAGWLACRHVGYGRMTEPAKIVEEVVRMLTEPGALPPPVLGLPEPAELDDDE
jgi:phosphopantothenoylcysteine decarboxylase/phosphopantothenate--cysteine ligase